MRNLMRKATTTQMLKISDLTVDPTVNVRPVKAAKIAKYTANFNPGALGILEVSKRADGAIIVLDGQHRLEMLRQLGWTNGQTVECRVHTGLTHADECRLFVQLNDETPVSAIHKMMANIGAGSLPDAAISEVVESVGLTISDQAADGHICAANALRFVWGGGRAGTSGAAKTAVDHPELLRSTLRLILASWGPQSVALRGDMIQGFGVFLARYGDTPKIDLESLTKKLAQFKGGPAGFLGDAKSLKDLHKSELRSAIAALMVMQYNQGRRSSKLPAWWSS